VSGILSPENLRTTLVLIALFGVIIAAALIIAAPIRKVAKAKEETNGLIDVLTDSLSDRVDEIDEHVAAIALRVHALEGYVGQLLHRILPELHPHFDGIASTPAHGGQDASRSGPALTSGDNSALPNGDDARPVERPLPRRIVGPPFNRDNPDPEEVARCMYEMLPPNVRFDDIHPDGSKFGGGNWFDFTRAQLATRYDFLMTQDLIRRVWDEINSWAWPT